MPDADRAPFLERARALAPNLDSLDAEATRGTAGVHAALTAQVQQHNLQGIAVRCWPEFFTEDCVYRLQSRENHERGFPLSTLSFESKGMLKDRVYGIRETLFHDPYYQRHVVGAPVVLKAEPGRIESEANYAVFRTKLSELSSVFSVGRYIDVVVRSHNEEEAQLLQRDVTGRVFVGESELARSITDYVLQRVA